MSRSIAEVIGAEGIIPIPLRADVTVSILGLPRDLTPCEAAKIAAVVRALSPPSKPTEGSS